MGWRDDLATRLMADAAVAAELGERIAWFEAWRSWGRTFPQLVLEEISAGREYTHDGPDELDRPRVQANLLGDPATDFEAAEAAVIAAMEAGGTAGSTVFHPGFVDGRRTLEPADLGDGTRVMGISIDFVFHWETTA